jgi:hypothetical protein
MPSKADKLNNFVHAFGAARMLIQKANQGGALLEGLALYAALTDGFLRIGLVLKRQIVKNTAEVDDLLISRKRAANTIRSGKSREWPMQKASFRKKYSMN